MNKIPVIKVDNRYINLNTVTHFRSLDGGILFNMINGDTLWVSISIQDICYLLDSFDPELIKHIR